jgi:hypothetical protein
MSGETTSRKLPAELLVLLVAAFYSFYFAELRFSLNSEYGPSNLAALTSHSAFKPFQYRILLPSLADALCRLGSFPSDSPAKAFKVLEAASTFLTIAAFRYYVSSFFADRLTNALMALSLLYVLPFHLLLPRINPFYYPADTASIFFFSLALALMQRRKWLMYYAVFVFATLNRETSVFLTVTYALIALGREKTSGVFLHCAAQFLIWVGIKSALFAAFAGNPGPDGFEWRHMGTSVTHLSTNLSFLATPGNYPFLLSAFGFTWVPVLFNYRSIGVAFVRRSVLVVFPFFAGMLLVGNIYEIRIFGELIPIVLTAFLVIVGEPLAAGRSPKITSNPPPVP